MAVITIIIMLLSCSSPCFTRGESFRNVYYYNHLPTLCIILYHSLTRYLTLLLAVALHNEVADTRSQTIKLVYT